MPLESASSIEDLDERWPVSQDAVSNGPAHLRMIKDVLKTIFPGASGNGLASPVTAKEDEFNALVGVTGNIQTRLNSVETKTNSLTAAINQLNAPAGTKMPFYQAAPPVGWTAVNLGADRILKVVTSNGGISEGNGGVTLNHAVGVTVQGHALSINQIPNIQYAQVLTRSAFGPEFPSGTIGVAAYDPAQYGGPTIGLRTQSVGSNHAHTHGATANNVAWSPSYTNVIIASKN